MCPLKKNSFCGGKIALEYFIKKKTLSHTQVKKTLNPCSTHSPIHNGIEAYVKITATGAKPYTCTLA